MEETTGLAPAGLPPATVVPEGKAEQSPSPRPVLLEWATVHKKLAAAVSAAALLAVVTVALTAGVALGNQSSIAQNQADSAALRADFAAIPCPEGFAIATGKVLRASDIVREAVSTRGNATADTDIDALVDAGINEHRTRACDADPSYIWVARTPREFDAATIDHQSITYIIHPFLPSDVTNEPEATKRAIRYGFQQFLYTEFVSTASLEWPPGTGVRKEMVFTYVPMGEDSAYIVATGVACAPCQ